MVSQGKWMPGSLMVSRTLPNSSNTTHSRSRTTTYKPSTRTQNRKNGMAMKLPKNEIAKAIKKVHHFTPPARAAPAVASA